MPIRREPNPQNRLACDRCHSQKLRCQRQDGQGICARCSRLRTACVFSPRQRRNGNQNHDGCDVNVRSQGTSLDLPTPSTTTSETNLAGMQNEPHHLDSLSHTLGHVIEPSPPISIAASTTKAGLGPAATSLPVPGSPGLTDFSALLDFDLSRLGSTSSDSSEWNFPMDLATFWPPHAGKEVGRHDSLIPSVQEEPMDTALDVRDTEADVTTLSPSTPARDADAPDFVHPVRKLADLNVRLYEHSTALPPVTMMASDKVPSLEGRLFAIDETFRMTQSLIDLLKTLYPRNGPTSDLVSDQGTLLLIMSCSNRVFDIYEVIFGHMRGCVQHNITPVTPDGKTVLLPELRIGSFSPPAPSAIAMQMLLIVMMASELFDQLRDVLGCWNSGDLSSRAAGRRFPDFAEDVGSELVKRAGTVAGEIGSARQMLLNVAGVPSMGVLGGMGRALQPR